MKLSILSRYKLFNHKAEQKKFLDSRDPAGSVLQKFMVFFYNKIFYHVILYNENYLTAYTYFINKINNYLRDLSATRNFVSLLRFFLFETVI